MSSAVTRYEWNAFNQLTRIVRPDLSAVTFEYDALGRRVEVADGAAVEQIVYDRTNPRLVLDGAGQVVMRQVHGLGLNDVLAMSAGGATVYPVAGATSTVVATTDAAGGVVDRFRYDSFGNGSTAAGSHGWQGLDQGGEGLYHAGAREYDPSLGRFISEDPVPSVNQYAYAFDSPLVASDPTGMVAAVEYSSETSANTSRSAASLCNQGSLVSGLFQDIVTDMLFTSAMAALPNVQGLYMFVDQTRGGQPYVGRSIHLRERILQHMADARPNQSFRLFFLDLSHLADDFLPAAEQLAIRDCGGGSLNGMANRINAVNRTRRDQLARFKSLSDYLANPIRV